MRLLTGPDPSLGGEGWDRKGVEVGYRGTHTALFALLFFCMGWVHQKDFHFGTPPSRLNLLHSLVVHGTFRIDAYHHNTPDKAVSQGHYYSDKAPGTVVVALPAFALCAFALRLAGIALDSETGWFVSSWVACAGSLAVIAALGGVALFAWLCRWAPPRAALIVTAAVFLGAAPLPYATLMFSHSLVVGLLAIALWAIQRQTEAEMLVWDQPRAVRDLVVGEGTAVSAHTASSSECRAPKLEGGFWAQRVRQWLDAGRWDLLAGFVCGWALASEYTAGLVVTGIGLLVLRMGWERGVRFALGAIPPLLMIPAYSWVCLGDPFTLPYSHQAMFPKMQEGLYAIKWPDATTAYHLLIGPTRGLFFWSPFLLMAGVGYCLLIQRSPAWFWATYALAMIQVIVISGRTWDWQAGHTLGPRYLAPILPLLALPCVLAVKRLPRLGAALAVLSVLMVTLATLTDATPNYAIHNPLTELHLPLLMQGEFSPNLGMILGLPPYMSVAIYYLTLAVGLSWLWLRLRSSNEGSHAPPQAGLQGA